MSEVWDWKVGFTHQNGILILCKVGFYSPNVVIIKKLFYDLESWMVSSAAVIFRGTHRTSSDLPVAEVERTSPLRVLAPSGRGLWQICIHSIYLSIYLYIYPQWSGLSLFGLFGLATGDQWRPPAQVQGKWANERGKMAIVGQKFQKKWKKYSKIW